MTTAIVPPSLVTVYISLQERERLYFQRFFIGGMSLQIVLWDLPLRNLSATKSVGRYRHEGSFQEGDQFSIFAAG